MEKEIMEESHKVSLSKVMRLRELTETSEANEDEGSLSRESHKD